MYTTDTCDVVLSDCEVERRDGVVSREHLHNTSQRQFTCCSTIVDRYVGARGRGHGADRIKLAVNTPPNDIDLTFAIETCSFTLPADIARLIAQQLGQDHYHGPTQNTTHHKDVPFNFVLAFLVLFVFRLFCQLCFVLEHKRLGRNSNV